MATDGSLSFLGRGTRAPSGVTSNEHRVRSRVTLSQKSDRGPVSENKDNFSTVSSTGKTDMRQDPTPLHRATFMGAGESVPTFVVSATWPRYQLSIICVAHSRNRLLQNLDFSCSLHEEDQPNCAVGPGWASLTCTGCVDHDGASVFTKYTGDRMVCASHRNHS